MQLHNENILIKMIFLSYFSSYKNLNMADYLQFLTIIKRSIIITVYLLSNAFNVKLLWDGENQLCAISRKTHSDQQFRKVYLNLFLISDHFNRSV